MAPIYTTFPDVQTTILAGAGEIQLHLRTSGTSIEAAQERVDTLAEKIEIELGNLVFSDNGDSLDRFWVLPSDAACDPRRGGELPPAAYSRNGLLRLREALDIFWAERWCIPMN